MATATTTKLAEALSRFPFNGLTNFSHEGNGTAHGKDYTYSIDCRYAKNADGSTDQNALEILLKINNWVDKDGNTQNLSVSGKLDYNPAFTGKPKSVIPAAKGTIDSVEFEAMLLYFENSSWAVGMIEPHQKLTSPCLSFNVWMQGAKNNTKWYLQFLSGKQENSQQVASGDWK